MKEIFLILDTIDYKIKQTSFEILSYFRSMDNDLSIDIYSPEKISKEEIALLKPYNIRKLFLPKEDLDLSKIDSHVSTINNISSNNYDYFLSSSGDWNNTVLSLLSAYKKCDFYNNCTGMDKNIVKKPLYGDKIISDIEVSSPCSISFRKKSFEIIIPEGEGRDPETIEFLFLMPSMEWVFEGLENPEDAYAKWVGVQDADIIISVGRGISNKENIEKVNELVELFGERACLGASRVVVDQGWTSFSNQIGQTGKVVSPTLYIALGISGAVQHQVGMNPSKYIISINKDKEAPIFEISDYCIADDLFEFLPILIRELKKVKDQ